MKMAGDIDFEMAMDMTTEKYIIFRRKHQTSLYVMDPQMLIAEHAIHVMNDDDDEDAKLEASSLIRYILHIRPDPSFQQVIDAGLVPHFVEFLTRDDLPNLQYEAVNILSIFAESSEHINVIVQNGAIPRLVDLLDAPDELNRELVILTLGLIAGKSLELCAQVLEKQVLQPLLAEFQKDVRTEWTVQIASWTLLQLCKGNPKWNSEMYSKVVAAGLQILRNHFSDEARANACWILYCLSYAKIGEAQIVIMNQVCYHMDHSLRHRSPWVIIPALETLANIASGDTMLSKYMVDDLKIIPQIEGFIDRGYGYIVKKAVCRIIANVSQKHSNNTREKINAIRTLFKATDVGVKTGAAWAISNITCNSSPLDIKIVVTQKPIIMLLCDMLDCSDTEIGFNCLRGLGRILDIWQEELIDGKSEDVFRYIEMIEDCEGLQKIINLRNLGHGLVSQTAQLILHNYWLDII